VLDKWAKLPALPDALAGLFTNAPQVLFCYYFIPILICLLVIRDLSWTKKKRASWHAVFYPNRGTGQRIDIELNTGKKAGQLH
jgi:hypothetical protein